MDGQRWYQVYEIRDGFYDYGSIEIWDWAQGPENTRLSFFLSFCFWMMFFFLLPSVVSL